jgi:hypothetical protein
MANWTDLSGAFGLNTVLTSTQMQQLRDNITAVTEGSSGAPNIVTAAVTSGAITTSKIAADAITNTQVADDAIQSENIQEFHTCKWAGDSFKSATSSSYVSIFAGVIPIATDDTILRTAALLWNTTSANATYIRITIDGSITNDVFTTSGVPTPVAVDVNVGSLSGSFYSYLVEMRSFSGASTANANGVAIFALT